jgi:cell division protein FtsN
MKRQNQSPIVAKFFNLNTSWNMAIAPAITLALGAWLTLAVNAAETLPLVGNKKALPNSVARFSPERQVFQISNSNFTPRELEFRAPSPAPVSPKPVSPVPTTRVTSYLVYVNNPNASKLQQIKQFEPSAFVRQYRQRTVIQAGIFQHTANAQKLAIALESQGIDARIVNLVTGEDIDFTGKFYFVVIPAKQDKLGEIEQRIQQLRMGMPIRISQRQAPRTHVRVGPFLAKEQAENWRRYLRASGLRRARVYYGQ